MTRVRYQLLLEGEEIIFSLRRGNFMEVCSSYGGPSQWKDQEEIDPEMDFVLSPAVRNFQAFDEKLFLIIGTFDTLQDFDTWVRYYLKAHVLSSTVISP